jgi:hypothetical protein
MDFYPEILDIFYFSLHTDKKENIIFLIYKVIQSGACSCKVIFEENRKYFPIYEEAVSHI